MTDINPTMIPPAHRAGRNRFFRWLGRTAYRLMGWKLIGRFPEDDRYIMVFAPHTSNWDFIIGIFAMLGLDLRCNWLAKISLFKPPFGGIMKWLGGIPVDRKNPGTMAEDTAVAIKQSPAVVLLITPEGTRSKVKDWKTGFLRIAKAAECRMLLISMDYRKKAIVLGDVLEPQENYQGQILDIRNYFQQFAPKIPKNF